MTVEDAQTCGADSRCRTCVTWTGDETTPVYAVVTAVASVTGEDPCDLPPLARTVDPDALNVLLSSAAVADETTVQFEYAGQTVVVRGSGEVELYDR